MPESLAHDLRVDAAGEQLGGVCVPQVVGPGARQPKLSDESAEVGRHGPRREGLPDLVGQGDAVVGPYVANAHLLRGLALRWRFRRKFHITPKASGVHEPAAA